MWLNPQETGDSVTFTEEILNSKLYFLCSLLFALFLSRSLSQSKIEIRKIYGQ